MPAVEHTLSIIGFSRLDGLSAPNSAFTVVAAEAVSADRGDGGRFGAGVIQSIYEARAIRQAKRAAVHSNRRSSGFRNQRRIRVPLESAGGSKTRLTRAVSPAADRRRNR